MAQLMEQHNFNRNNKQVHPGKELVPSRPAVKSNETCTIIIDDDEDDVVDVTCPDVIKQPHQKITDKRVSAEPVAEVKQDNIKSNDVSNEIVQVTDKVTSVRRRPKPPDLPKKRQHKTVRVSLPKSSISHVSVKSFKPTISLQKLFAGTSPRLVVKENDLQPAVALTEQYNTLPPQHPVHNWITGIKRHKFRIYTK